MQGDAPGQHGDHRAQLRGREFRPARRDLAGSRQNLLLLAGAVDMGSECFAEPPGIRQQVADARQHDALDLRGGDAKTLGASRVLLISGCET